MPLNVRPEKNGASSHHFKIAASIESGSHLPGRGPFFIKTLPILTHKASFSRKQEWTHHQRSTM
jgi:hypothetical protein